MGVCFTCIYVKDTVECCSASGDQKRESDPLKLELRMVVNHLMGAGNWTPILNKRVLLTMEPAF